MHNYTLIFRPHLIKLSEDCREKNHYTQERMAESLHISARAYNNVKRDRQSLSASTLIFLLLMLSEEEVLAFLQDMRNLVEQESAENDMLYENVLEIG